MSRPPLLTLDEALPQLLAHAQVLSETQTVSTFDADGRVLAQDVVSALQVPPQDNSSMDGYALRFADCAKADAVLKGYFWSADKYDLLPCSITTDK